MRTSLRLAASAALALLAAGCVAEPFSYAQNRCTGGYNQCTNSCAQTSDTPASSACLDRCLANETRCVDTGDDSGSLAQSTAIGAAQSQAVKEADYREWRRKKAADAAATQAATK